MIEFFIWRELFYKLVEEYFDCLMFNFIVKVNSIFFIYVYVGFFFRYNFRLEIIFCLIFIKEEKIVFIKFMFKY